MKNYMRRFLIGLIDFIEMLFVGLSIPAILYVIASRPQVLPF